MGQQKSIVNWNWSPCGRSSNGTS